MLHLDLAAAGEYEFPGDDAPVFDAGGDVVLAPFALLEAQASGGEEDVKVVDINYRLKVITGPVGTTVIWEYDASLPHTVTSDTNVFNSGTMGNGDRFSYTFEEAGVFPYYCTFHGGAGGSGMSGVVNVTEG
jgi:plastocyanin